MSHVCLKRYITLFVLGLTATSFHASCVADALGTCHSYYHNRLMSSYSSYLNHQGESLVFRRYNKLHTKMNHVSQTHHNRTETTFSDSELLTFRLALIHVLVINCILSPLDVLVCFQFHVNDLYFFHLFFLWLDEDCGTSTSTLFYH